MKNFAFAFQIQAAFNGNKAFTDAVIRTKELAQSTRDCAKIMQAADQAYKNNLISLNSRNNAQQQLGQHYTTIAKQYQAAQKLATAQGKFESSFTNMGKYAANAYQFYEIGKGLMSASNTAMDFEAKLSKVKAITGATAQDMLTLEKTALELGQKTKFSASQSAEAMSYLGMAGWKTNEIIAGMPGLLNLAAASGEDLASVADIISDDLTAFGMKAEQAGHMADVFAAASNNANTNVAMMGQTFKYAGAVAGSLGFSLEDVAIATGLMANAGIKADQAGTSLRSIMTRLVKPPKQAAEALDELGISAVNSDGSMKPLMQIVNELRQKFAGLSEAQKGSLGAAIAGQEAMSGFLSLMNAGDADIDKLSQAINNCNGAAGKMADTMNDNAQGSIVAFQSAIETLQITVGKTLLPIITEAAKGMTSFAQSLGSFSAEYPGVASGALAVTTSIFVLGAAGNGLMWIFNGVKTVIMGSKAAWALMQLAMNSSTVATIASTAAQWAMNAAMYACPVGIMIAGIAALVAAGYALYTNWDTVKQFFVNLWESPTARVFMFITGPVGWLIAAGGDLIANWDTVKQWFITLWDNPALALQQFVDGIKSKFTDAFAWIQEKWQAISDFISKPIFGKVNITAQGSGAGAGVAHNAAGGIYGRGAFLTTFAENEGESAIPHTPNARNVGLLAETNRIMGNPLGGGSITATFAPNITIHGNGDEGKIREVLEIEMARFKKMLADLQNQQRRVSYA